MLPTQFRNVPRHRDMLTVQDGCKDINHGFGRSKCRIHLNAWQYGRYIPRHYCHTDSPLHF